MKTTGRAVRLLSAALLGAGGTASWAIDGQLAPADKQDFICKVAPNIGVADSFWSQQRTMSKIRGGNGCPQSWWQQAPFTGEKYTVLACDTVRVVAGTAESAAQELYATYLKNAPQQPAQRHGMVGTEARHLSKAELVPGCEPDPSSSRGVAIQPLTTTSSRLVTADIDHLATSMSMYPEKVDDEALVLLFNPQFKAPSDAFERREAIAKAAGDARAAIKRVAPGAFRIETAVHVSPFSFETNKFELPTLEADVQQVSYSYNAMANAPRATMPNYAWTIPAALKAGYVPTSTDEAKRIEKARAAASYNLKAVVFVQPTKARMVSGRPVLNALVSRIDVVDGKGKVLFSVTAR